jgi:hypothetical protein
MDLVCCNVHMHGEGVSPLMEEAHVHMHGIYRYHLRLPIRTLIRTAHQHTDSLGGMRKSTIELRAGHDS